MVRRPHTDYGSEPAANSMWRWLRLVNRCAAILSIHHAFIMHSFSHGHSPLGDLSDVDAAGAWRPGWDSGRFECFRGRGSLCGQSGESSWARSRLRVIIILNRHCSEIRIEHNFLPTDHADVACNRMRRDRGFRDLGHQLLSGY